jgi:hypothetical protein
MMEAPITHSNVKFYVAVVDGQETESFCHIGEVGAYDSEGNTLSGISIDITNERGVLGIKH